VRDTEFVFFFTEGRFFVVVFLKIPLVLKGLRNFRHLTMDIQWHSWTSMAEVELS